MRGLPLLIVIISFSISAAAQAGYPVFNGTWVAARMSTTPKLAGISYAMDATVTVGPIGPNGIASLQISGTDPFQVLQGECDLTKGVCSMQSQPSSVVSYCGGVLQVTGPNMALVVVCKIAAGDNVMGYEDVTYVCASGPCHKSHNMDALRNHLFRVR